MRGRWRRSTCATLLVERNDSTMLRLFLDTNILLDVLLRREPFYRSAARVWTLAETGAHEGFVSAISFNNVFYPRVSDSGRRG